MRQSAILGYLAAGMLLGPYGLHWVETREEVSLLAELGVALLLFSIGLEFSWSRLRRTGAAGLGGGSLQVVVTVLLGAGLLALFGMEPRRAIAMGAVLALSSTAYVLRVLASRAEIDSLHGRTAVGVLLAQDVAVVPLVMLVSVLGGGGSGGEILMELGRLLGFALLLVLAIWVVFTHLVPRLLGAEVLRRNRELPLLLAVASGLGSALGAHTLGLSPALGALLTGMMLAETPFAPQVRADVSALRTLLLALFFGSIGMLRDLGWIAGHPLQVALFVGGAVIGKGLVATLVLRVMRVPWLPGPGSSRGPATTFMAKGSGRRAPTPWWTRRSRWAGRSPASSSVSSRAWAAGWTRERRSSASGARPRAGSQSVAGAGCPSQKALRLASSFSRASQLVLRISRPKRRKITLKRPLPDTLDRWVTRVRPDRSSKEYSASMSKALPIIRTALA